MSIVDEIKASFKEGNTLNKLIYINLGVFVAVHVISAALILFMPDREYAFWIRYLAVPADTAELIRRPWTPLTYMFLHRGFMHFLGNLLWLYWFGQVFMQELGEKKLLSIYLAGGLAGALLYIISYNLFDVFEAQNSYTLGASAAVTAIVIAVSVYRPERRMNIVFIGPVKIIYIALVMFFLTSVVEFESNAGGKIAHIGGALTGLLFAYYYRRGKDVFRGFDRFMDQAGSLFKPRQPKMKVTHKKAADDIEYNKQKKEEQKVVDQILDKISKGGYESLSAREKEILFRMSGKK